MRKAEFMIVKPLFLFSRKNYCFYLSYCFFLVFFDLYAQEEKNTQDFSINLKSTLFTQASFMSREHKIDKSRLLNPYINPYRFSNFELNFSIDGSQNFSFVSDILYFFDFYDFFKLKNFKSESFEIKNSFFEFRSDFLPTLWFGYKSIDRKQLSLFSGPNLLGLYLFGGGLNYSDWNMDFGIANEVNTDLNFIENSYHFFEYGGFSNYNFKKPIYQFNITNKIYLPKGDVIEPMIGVNLFQTRASQDSSKKGFLNNRIGGTLGFVYLRSFGVLNTGETTFFFNIIPVQQIASTTRSLVPIMLSSRGEDNEISNIFGVEDSSKWNITKDFSLFTGLSIKSYSYTLKIKDQKDEKDEITYKNWYKTSFYFKVQPEFSYQSLFMGLNLGAYYVTKRIKNDDEFLFLNPYLKFCPEKLFLINSLFISLNYTKYSFLEEGFFSFRKKTSHFSMSLGFNLNMSN